MIEFHIQPSLSILPGLPEPAQAGASEAFNFEGQLTLLISKAPVADGLPDGKAPPAPGKALPPLPELVADPLAPDMQEIEIELSRIIPIMRPLNLRPKGTLSPLPDTVPVAAVTVPATESTSAVETDALPNSEMALLALTMPQLQVQPRYVADEPMKSSAKPVARSIVAAQPALTKPSTEQQQPALAPAVVAAEQTDPQTTRPVKSGEQPTSNNAGAVPHPTTKAEVVPAFAPATSTLPAAALVAQPPAGLQASAQPTRSSDPRRRAAVAAITANAASRLPPVRLAPFDLPRLPQPKSPQPGLAFAESATTQTVVTGALAPAPAQTNAPHDFAALIDRIVAAREASGAPVSVAVRHAEFGAVTLRIEQDEGGVAVSATSPDPDFARAAAAALRAERPTNSEAAPREGARSSAPGESANGGSGSGQSRQHTSAPGTPARNRSAHSATTNETRDSGIFA